MSLVIVVQTIWNSVSSPKARPPMWHHLHTSLCNGHSGHDHPGGLGGPGGGLESWTEANGQWARELGLGPHTILGGCVHPGALVERQK